MRPPSSIQPFTPSAAITLHPTLQAVLDNLDVQIEAELSRYRRQRRNPNAAPRRQSIAAQSPAMGILKQSIQLPQPRSSIYAEPDSAGPAAHPTNTAAQPQAAAQITQSPPIQAWVAPSPTPQSPALQPHPVQSAESAELAERLSSSPVPTFDTWTAAAHRPNLEPPVPAPAPDPAAIASYAEQYDLSAYAPDSVLQRLMQQLEPPISAAGSAAGQALAIDGYAEDANYADYLASSEELLRSIAEESSMRQAEQEPNSLLNTLLTPLGIGSMLLLLLSSMTLGYVVMNPGSVGLKMAQPETPADLKPADSSVAAGTGQAGQEAMPSPNLSADEFRDLGLDTLSSIPKPVASGAAPGAVSKSTANGASRPAQPTASQSVRSSVAPSAPVDAAPQSRPPEPPAAPELPAAPAIQPSLATVVVPAPVRRVEPPVHTHRAAPKPVISPEPISIAPPPLSSVAPAGSAPSPASAESGGHYYVVTEYTGDPSLRAARGAVPDAYVRNIPAAGAKVQLGAFSDEAGAAALQQDLRRRGIEAEVYRP